MDLKTFQNHYGNFGINCEMEFDSQITKVIYDDDCFYYSQQ